MREIKFRGRRVDNGEWVYGVPLVTSMSGVYMVNSKQTVRKKRSGGVSIGDDVVHHEVDPKTIGQYTGLKDKNGQEIYEGDILSFDGNMTADNSMGAEPNGFIYDENSKHAVVWNETLALWELNFAEDEIWKYKRDTRGLMIDGHCKVIGNIYENPDLLEGK